LFRTEKTELNFLLQTVKNQPEAIPMGFFLNPLPFFKNKILSFSRSHIKTNQLKKYTNKIQKLQFIILQATQRLYDLD